MAIPDLVRLPAPRTAGKILAIALIPVALEAGYLFYLKRSVSRHTTASAGLRYPRDPTKSGDSKSAGAAASNGIPASVVKPVSLPLEVADDSSSEYVLSYERVVSQPLPASSLRHPLPSALLSGAPDVSTGASLLLTVYLRATMKAFGWTPQAFAIRAAVGSSEAKRTFDDAYIDNLDFREGDRVDGVYTVAFRGSRDGQSEERVEMLLDPPASYRGPVVKGLIACGVEPVPSLEGVEKPAKVVFINETWLYRKTDEKPTLLEGAAGRWIHSLLAGWLIMKGLKVVSH
ncbi:hypothetical protein VTK73DRAFT_1556 [Phialemonium thermophilum]|uniref:Uncharacterized protein n=1 Tax=Phialemonium thermophilum TaxID=223376 RepID=A0ABR3X9J0_9PEZI